VCRSRREEKSPSGAPKTQKKELVSVIKSLRALRVPVVTRVCGAVSAGLLTSAGLTYESSSKTQRPDSS
jgi:hypothetical protein